MSNKGGRDEADAEDHDGGERAIHASFHPSADLVRNPIAEQTTGLRGRPRQGPDVRMATANELFTRSGRVAPRMLYARTQLNVAAQAPVFAARGHNYRRRRRHTAAAGMERSVHK